MATNNPSNDNQQAQAAQHAYATQLDIPSVTLLEAQEQIELGLLASQRRFCPVLVGESGLGKTQIFSQIARKHGYTVMPIHAAQFNLVGAGVPSRAENGRFKIAVPDMFPRPEEKVIVLFDELNRAVRHAINMFFTMLEDRRMFDYTLPEHCMVAAAMNPSDDDYNVTKIENEPAIRRRVKFMWVTVSPTDWLNHASTPEFHHGDCVVARDKPCHPDILSYFRANLKHVYDVNARKAGKQYVCPANIQTISEDAYVLRSAGRSLTGECARTRFAASIGETAAQQLIAYIENHAVMVGADDVLYRPREASRAIQKLLNDSQHEKLADLSENVLALLFSDLPENLNQIARNFVKFCTTLPTEQAAAFCQQMRGYADTEKKLEYLRNLMGTLQHQDGWFELQSLFDKTHRDIDAAIQNGNP